MVSATPGSKPNPKNLKNVYHVGGLQVEFPYQPYGSQLAFMGRVISTLDRAQREGHCHALLESPTGTGKSLSLLCSSLAWRQSFDSKNQCLASSQSKPAPEAMTDPLAYGGGFIPEVEPSGNPGPENLEPPQAAANSKNQKKRATPVIYYASRTHSQISQVIREYRKTSYRVPMAVLASRKHYCTNRHIRGKKNIDEECKLLLSSREVGCPEFRNFHKVKGHPSLQKGGCHEVHDIEDLVKVGQVVKGCSYYAARSMADDAQLVFCPYNYIINPVIRGAMDVDIRGAIVILDEAHNIEDIARDAGSVDVEEDVLHKLQMELEQLSVVDFLTYQPLYEMSQDLINWIEGRKSTLEKRGFQHHITCWTGDKALRELQEANITRQCFPILLECATKAIKAASDIESDVPHLSGMSVIILEGLFSSLTYFFSRNGCHISCYQLALQRYVKRDAGKPGNWSCTLSLWCLNPAVVFRDIADLALSVILTSGTLSPMNSFSSELGVQFETCLEAPHVIDVESQLWSAIISSGPGNYPMNASYKTADAYQFQDALGKSLEEIFKIVPGGCLVFFPSYKLMEKLCNRWRETGQWSQLNVKKSLFVEPRGGSQDDFEPVLKGYYDSIHQDKPAFGRKRRVKKIEVNHFDAGESLENPKKGAAFLAVCRGKVSEGIDFTDDNARVVIIIGIPFPNINDIQVALKKKYNDTHKSSKGLLSGNEWYCHQAFRALNQAAGRCIRHRFDYGAIILLDERYREERNRAYISKWLRKSIRQYDSFEISIEGLKSFFKDVKERMGKNTTNAVNNFDINEEKSENMTVMDQNKVFRGVKNQKLSKSDHCGQKVISGSNYDASLSLEKSQGDVEVDASLRMDEDSNNCTQHFDLQCSFQKESRWPEALSMTFSHKDPEVSLVKETPCSTASPGTFSKDDNFSATIIDASTEFQDQVLTCSFALPDTNKALSGTQCSVLVTPERNMTMNTNSILSEMELSLNLSVNSHTQKRRKSMGSPVTDLTQEEQSDVPHAKSPAHTSLMRSSIASRDANRRIEFGLESDGIEQKFKKSNVSQLLSENDYVASCALSIPVMEKRLQISCSLCKSPLGLPENQYIMCSLTSSSKVHLASLLKENLKHCVDTQSVQVVMTDTSSVHPELCTGTIESAPAQGIWCEEDGCVFNTIFCPFCRNLSHFLGVQIVATDASNIQLLNKILFYHEHLEIKNLEASRDEVSEESKLLPLSSSGREKKAILNSIDQFAYSPGQSSGGWRTTKSKLRLPKKGLHSTTKG